MQEFKLLKPESVFHFFGELSKIPRGSGNMKAIADYCMGFANERNLTAIRDNADNVIIYKAPTTGYENSAPIILQGHLDMVCQKTADCEIDFENDPLTLYIDGEFVKAKGTTLGADNGIAVAMVLAILDSKDICHPPIEAVFTTDEEIGMIGASALDMSALKAKKMINLDSEEDDTLTVSCAGGIDFTATCLPQITTADGTALKLIIGGLKGGHSGVEIDKGRINSNILAGRFLNHLNNVCNFDIISVTGGDKGNAIPLRTEITLCTSEPDKLKNEALSYAEIVKREISAREPDFTLEIIQTEKSEFTVFTKDFTDKLIYALNLSPNGIQQMSRDIDGLVETSLNLGILKADEKGILMHYALRSNKATALDELVDRLSLFAKELSFEYKVGGHYPPWEFNENSELQKLYGDIYKEKVGVSPKVEAIHAGLECAVFADKLKGLDCIAIGPTLFDVHTVNERMLIPSVEKVYNIVIEILKRSK